MIEKAVMTELGKQKYDRCLKKMEANEIQAVELSILVDVAEFCFKKNITFYLAFGTLIGALRHKGFIPWDDDIDIMMPRPDYEKFLKTYNSASITRKFRVSDGTNKQMKTIFAKVYDTETIKIEEGCDYSEYTPIGIDIDIFPVDGLPSNNTLYSFLIKWIGLLNKLFGICIRPIIDTNYKKFIKKIIIIIGQDTYCRLINRSLKFFPYERAKKRGMRVFIFPNEDDRHDATVFDGSVEAEFEGNAYPIPVGYEAYLQRIYGDWRTLPPISEQITHHKNSCYYCCTNKRKRS